MQVQLNLDKIMGTLHEDLNTFMTSWVTGVAMVSNILTDFLVPVITSVTKVTIVHWSLWFPAYAISDVLCRHFL
jgi:hypothetical protein